LETTMLNNLQIESCSAICFESPSAFRAGKSFSCEQRVLKLSSASDEDDAPERRERVAYDPTKFEQVVTSGPPKRSTPHPQEIIE
jgi:hypothetical protein